MTAPVRVCGAGVIAAGSGERLRAGASTLKPLVAVGGRTLVERVLESIAETGARETVVIINEASLAVREHVDARRWPFAIDWIVETTPSSMHSFLRVVERLAAGGHPAPYLISTVDTVAPPGAFARLAAEAGADADVTLALTSAVDDEKPLLVEIDGSRVTALGDGARGPYATCGYYLVRPSVLREANAARRDGLSALRLFLARILARGYRIDGIVSAESIDVDRPADVAAAERFLRRVAP
ncbi:MAG: nucleotidyltransferase family protein [Betaproteobacteria bacterium]